MSLEKKVEKVFRRIHAILGKPKIVVVGPIDTWSLPTGFVYDEMSDRVTNTQGVELDDVQTYMSQTEVEMIPPDESSGLVLLQGGMADTGSASVVVMPSSTALLREAFAVILDGVWYNVTGVTEQPAGAPSKAWAVVRLQLRG